MFGINFKDDSWRKVYAKAKSVKDSKEQLIVNQAALDYIRALQLQIDELRHEVDELKEYDVKKRLGW